MSIPELEKQLAEARARLQTFLSPLTNVPAAHVAFEEVSIAQRALAAAKDEEYADRYEVGFVPEGAAPAPVLLQNERTVFLVFSAVKETSDGKREPLGYATIEVAQCQLTKFGYPNDEALPGHPLYGKGLSAYGVFEVKNSTWIKVMTEQNRISFPNTPDSKARHFIITFHDSTFECIAQGLVSSLSVKSIAELFAELQTRLLADS